MAKDLHAPYLVKLVRDRVDEHLGEPGRIFYAPLDEATFIKLLQRKLVDEAVEYLVDPSTEELADVYEVIRGLSEHIPGGMDAVIAEADRKEAERGGFKRGIGMFNVIDPSDRSDSATTGSRDGSATTGSRGDSATTGSRGDSATTGSRGDETGEN